MHLECTSRFKQAMVISWAIYFWRDWKGLRNLDSTGSHWIISPALGADQNTWQYNFLPGIAIPSCASEKGSTRWSGFCGLGTKGAWTIFDNSVVTIKRSWITEATWFWKIPGGLVLTGTSFGTHQLLRIQTQNFFKFFSQNYRGSQCDQINKHGSTNENVRAFRVALPTCPLCSTSPYGGFLKYGYPQIIHFSRVFPEKNHLFWGTPMTLETPPIIEVDHVIFLHSRRSSNQSPPSM